MIEKIYLTASGGPFLNSYLKKIKKNKIKQALKSSKLENGKKNINWFSNYNE